VAVLTALKMLRCIFALDTMYARSSDATFASDFAATNEVTMARNVFRE
jgi:hypothetical protein